MKNSNLGCFAALAMLFLGNRLQKEAKAQQQAELRETGVTKPWAIPPAKTSNNPPAARPNYKDDGFDEGDVRHHYDY